MREENWIDWPEGAELRDLPVGSRVRYREAHYERTENGLRVYWAGKAKKLVGTEYFLNTQQFIDPIDVSLPPGYRFSGSEVVKDEPKRAPAYATFEQAWASREQKTVAGVDPAVPGPTGLGRPKSRQGDHQQEVQPKKPTCSCGATRNIHVSLSATVPLYECGSCAQVRRRAELQAAKLDQTKRAMDRPVKRDPYEWLGFSSASWEE